MSEGRDGKPLLNLELILNARENCVAGIIRSL